MKRLNARQFRFLFFFFSVIGPLILVALLTAIDPNTSFARESIWRQAGSICREFDAELRTLSLNSRHMTIAIPNRLLNDTIEGPYFASQLFLKLCELGGPKMELWVERIHPVVSLNGAWSPETKDSGEQWVEDYYRDIPTARNPVTLEWARELVKRDPFE